MSLSCLQYQGHCYNPVAPAYHIWAYYAHGQQRRCLGDPQSSRFGSEPPSVEDDIDVWRFAILRVACQKQQRRRRHLALE